MSLNNSIQFADSPGTALGAGLLPTTKKANKMVNPNKGKPTKNQDQLRSVLKMNESNIKNQNINSKSILFPRFTLYFIDYTSASKIEQNATVANRSQKPQRTSLEPNSIGDTPNQAQSRLALMESEQRKVMSSAQSTSQQLANINELTNASKIVRTHQLYDGGTMQQKVLSAVQLPTLGGKRRVHNDGIMMLDNHYNMREMEQKHQIMENRLKRLEDEERRANKNQRAAEKKAADMLQSRSRHYQELMEKIKHYEDKNNMVEL